MFDDAGLKVCRVDLWPGSNYNLLSNLTFILCTMVQTHRQITPVKHIQLAMTYLE